MRWYYHHEFLGSHPLALMTRHKQFSAQIVKSTLRRERFCPCLTWLTSGVNPWTGLNKTVWWGEIVSPFRRKPQALMWHESRFTLTVHFSIDPKIKPEDIFSLWRSRGRFLLNHSGAIKNVENDISRCLYDRNLVCWSAPEVKTTSAPFTFSIWKISKP